MPQQEETFTIGVEEEYQIVDPHTRELSPDAEQILPLAQEMLGDVVQYELMLSQIEIATPICRTLEDVHSELGRLRQGTIAAAEQFGKRIAAAGTHPISSWQEQQVTPRPRYQQLVRDYQQLVQQQVIFGCHVHIGINDREAALQVLNRARLWLPVLLALTANSPFWQQKDTRYASYRTPLWWASPPSGPPSMFASRADYEELVQTLVTTKSVVDVTRVYWDIRLPERFNTIEFRVMDVCMTLDEAVMVAGLVRALVQTCYKQAMNNEPIPDVHNELLRAASWQAARYGLDVDLIDIWEKRAVPARLLLESFLEFVRPALEAEGAWERVASSMQRVMQHGNGAARQRAVYGRTGNMQDVVDFIIAETAKDLPPFTR